MKKYFHMVKREFWRQQVQLHWQRRPVLWLTGVRRVGKTTLAQSFADAAYYDCELPRVRRLFEDPEGFLDDFGDGKLILDEVHRLANPSEILKIAADHYPEIRILATGSSTLGASQRFRDTLAGRKRELHLLPVLYRELPDFGEPTLRHRLRNGGLPENLLREDFPESDYSEWMSAFWARDIQELFRLEKRDAFMRLLECLLSQSGQLCELNSLTSLCGATRPTLKNYLGVLEATGAVHVLRPFAKHPKREITAMPKVYAFDTGFVCFARGWRALREEDMGFLWEHLVLDELIAEYGKENVFHWRDKQKHEVDFVLACRGQAPVAIECKWSANAQAGRHFRSIRTLYPEVRCLVVAADAGQPRLQRKGNWIETGLSHLRVAIPQVLAEKH